MNEKTPNHNKKLIIAGPCALESQAHAKITVEEAKRTGVSG